ncbi:isoleucine--tRNA ligase [Sphingobium algorifonticola]|uniref:Isoleucine--tRNA ligase n=1 Tax=Sphingobium algorifonticola TaxID=2008318 RepID=A0A437JCS8_9SPHN|nr:isoleucine--tRNA ligase [Sphingobium algorifonticola]RVT43701.1 isoleucine--tRNA ligase [Sphingobium algorifonticola]
MTDQPTTPSQETQDYKSTVFLPQTDFPMKAGLAQKEPAIAARWDAMDLYGQLRARRKGRERFILHDGPPYANGDIHMGHAMNKVLKDIIVRSQSLLGKDAPYVPGWDCHGLPIEWKIEEEYRKQKLNKDEVPPQEFRAQCRAYADKWVAVQKEQFKRLGVMGDWDDPYLTMKFEAEATIVGEILKFAESGQLYRGAKPVMWSPVEKTALAEAEVEYEDVTSTQIDVGFEIVEAPNAPGLIGALAVIWTTTPWTIPVNQALAFSPDADYVVLNCVNVVGCNPYIVLARDLVPAFCKRAGLPVPLEFGGDGREPEPNGPSVMAEPAFTILGEQLTGVSADMYSFSGQALSGAIARHPMHKLGGFFAKPRPFLPADHVTTDAGTGLVHMAPDHGEEDFLVCKAHGIDPVFAVNAEGKYRDDWLWLGGQGSVINMKFVSKDGPICTDLREAGALLAASDDFRHSYPHSWRSKARIIYRCTPQWFIPMDKPSTVRAERSRSPLLSEVEASDGASLRAAEPFDFAQGERIGDNAPTLRQTALNAIAHTRWVPARSTNRIRTMVEGRPDWVISRQRAWGVPIALYVHRQSGEYLNDPAVNARIIEAFKAGGADAWFGADHQALLGPDYKVDDYEVVNDILDVWFDSGSTHSFVVEARYGKGTRADLYLEGSDQHRGWFQSSLLESSGTRGCAPYKAVLTHGFALDGQGRKMSKSLGNVVDPLKIMSESGADILRVWVASTDYFDDVKIGKEVLAGASDAYRKLRNTFRYLLGALSDFTDAERVPVEDMPELERYMLHRLATLDAELRAVVDKDGASENWLEFSRYTRALFDFANADLSAFFFDIRKDCLYCDAKSDPKRMAYRTVLDTLFHALIRYAAPIIPFTAEEVWQSRFPDESESVHFLEWPDFAALLRHSRAGGNPSGNTDEGAGPEMSPRLRGDDGEWLLDTELDEKWGAIRSARDEVNEAIEPLRREKTIRSSLEAGVNIGAEFFELLKLNETDLAEIFITSEVKASTDLMAEELSVFKVDHHKCGRCWRLLPEVTEDGALCDRCDTVLTG